MERPTFELSLKPTDWPDPDKETKLTTLEPLTVAKVFLLLGSLVAYIETQLSRCEKAAQ